MLVPPDPACWAIIFRDQIHPLVDLMEPCNLTHRHCSGGSSGSSGISGRRPNSGNGKRSNGGFPILEHAIHAVWLECAIIIPRLLCGSMQAWFHSFSASVLFGGKLGITSVRFSVASSRSSSQGDRCEGGRSARVGNSLGLDGTACKAPKTSGCVFF